MFVVPGSLVCLLSWQSVGLAELPPRLIYSQRDSEPNSDLNGQPMEGFCHKIVFHWCYTLTSAEACIPELPPPPFQCFPIFNMTERAIIFSSEGVLWGSVPSLVPAQTGPPMPGKRLCFPEHPCWEGNSPVEEFYLGWNAEQATGISSITQLSLAIKVFSTKCFFCSQSNLGYDRFKKKKKKEFWDSPKMQRFLHGTPGNPWKSSCLCWAALQQQNTGESGGLVSL